MPKECTDCGADCVKTKGSYREFCQDCFAEMAADSRHVETCEKWDCRICQDKLDAYKDVIEPLYVKVLLEANFGSNHKLGEFE